MIFRVRLEPIISLENKVLNNSHAIIKKHVTWKELLDHVLRKGKAAKRRSQNSYYFGKVLKKNVQSIKVIANYVLWTSGDPTKFPQLLFQVLL